MTDDAHKARLTHDDLDAIDALAAPADDRLAQLHPGDTGSRQPVHTVYVPADQMTADLVRRWGTAATKALDSHARTATDFADALNLNRRRRQLLTGDGVWDALRRKLDSEPIEDLRVDLEDGYGDRGDGAEDRDAVASARALATAVQEGTAPPFCGVRFKSLEPGTRRRGLRTLDLVLGTLFDSGGLPPGWVVTLPKVTALEQVQAMVEACNRLESAHGLRDGILRFEVQIETPQAILGPDGAALVARLVDESGPRLAGLHFGTYDYTAALGIAAGYQAMDHPAAEHAKQVMALAVAGTAVRLSDGSSNVLPVGDRTAVHQAWALHARLVRRSLVRGFYQGWDLHPAQLPTRYAATYLFYRDGLDHVGHRLATYLGSVSGETADGGHLDEPATAQALAQFVLRGVDCGAVAAEEVSPLIGDDIETLRRLAARRPGAG
jgi:citrate lyase beta subunit